MALGQPLCCPAEILLDIGTLIYPNSYRMNRIYVRRNPQSSQLLYRLHHVTATAMIEGHVLGSTSAWAFGLVDPPFGTEVDMLSDIPGDSERKPGLSATNNLRIATVARLIGDHRNAPNLWLARQIVETLEHTDHPCRVPGSDQ